MWRKEFSLLGTRRIKFFRESLIRLDNESIVEYLVRLDTQIKKFKEELFRLSWYMRGGVSVNDLLDRYSHDDRQAMYEVVKENIELTKNSQMPLI
jgi:hypothetical protein